MGVNRGAGVTGAAFRPMGDNYADTLLEGRIFPKGHMEVRHLVSVLLEQPTTNMVGTLNIVCFLGVCQVKGKK